MDTKSEKRLERIKNTIRTYVNFPKEGIVFRYGAACVFPTLFISSISPF